MHATVVVGAEKPALHKMKEGEARKFIRRCAAALKSHHGDFCAGREKEDAQSAFASVTALLLEVSDIYPERRADIDRILMSFDYPMQENGSRVHPAVQLPKVTMFNAKIEMVDMSRAFREGK